MLYVLRQVSLQYLCLGFSGVKGFPQPEQVFEPEQVPDPEPYPEPEAAVPDDPVVDDLFEVEGEFADAEEEKPAEPEN